MNIEMDFSHKFCTACMLQNTRLDQKQSLDEMLADDAQWFTPIPEGTQPDALGYLWCESHAYRAELSAWFKANNFPYVSCEPLGMVYAGEWFARQAIMYGTDDFLAVVSVAIEGLAGEVSAQPPDVEMISVLWLKQDEVQAAGAAAQIEQKGA